MNGQMLSAPLALHDVEDVEGLCALALADALRGFRASLKPHDHEDALTYLIGIAWELSLRYDPERGWSFSKYCYRICKLRLVDWYRLRFGDSRRVESPELPLSLDAGTIYLHDGEQAADRALGDRLEQAVGGGTLDPAEDRDPDLARALATRGRRPAWLKHASSAAGPRRAA